MNIYRHLALSLLLVIGLLQSSHAYTAPNIVVTLKPLHSLVSAITDGITKPQLLLNTTQSPHHTYLRPSDYRKIANADIVFWATPSMEAFIPALEKKYNQHTKFISLMQVDGIQPLAIRHQHNNQDSHALEHTSWDPHFWLSTLNAKQMVKAITKQLIIIDPENTQNYLNNQTKTLRRITALQNHLAKLFKKSLPAFISYHDAYQYFEREFQLTRLASVSLNEETSPGIKQVRHIKKLIHDHQVACIFYNAPVRPPILDTLIHDSNVRAVELDILGINHPANESLWFDTLTTLGNNIWKCLSTPCAHKNH